MSMWKECEGLQEELVKMRRELHQIPEFGLDLPETQKYVTDKLDELGIPYKCSGTDSSIIAEIKGGQPGKTVALRADMDALKITEANDVDYKSKHEGLMHACGHDNHITMLLGAAKVLNAHKAEIKGNVRLLFQTAEELSKGAEIMIKDGAMDGVDAVFGQHIGSIINKDIPAGKVIITPGCCMASFDRFVIHVKGTGCHGSTPEKGTDPITMASHIVINLQEIIAREVSAVKAAVVTIGYLAIDRQNQKLDAFYDPHHPAVLAMIRMAAENAHAEGKWIGICGELGADLELTEEFLSMGLDELSVSPAMVLPLRKKIRETK